MTIECANLRHAEINLTPKCQNLGAFGGGKGENNTR